MRFEWFEFIKGLTPLCMSLLTLPIHLSLAKCIKQTLFQACIKSCYDIKKATCRWIDGFEYEFDRNCLSTVFDKYSQIFLEGGLKVDFFTKHYTCIGGL